MYYTQPYSIPINPLPFNASSFDLGEILSHVGMFMSLYVPVLTYDLMRLIFVMSITTEGTNKYRRMRYKKKVRGLTADGHFDEKHAALYFVDIMHGLAYLHRCVFLWSMMHPTLPHSSFLTIRMHHFF